MKAVGGGKIGSFTARTCVGHQPATARAVQGTIGGVKIWCQLNKIANLPNINHRQIFLLYGIYTERLVNTEWSVWCGVV